MAPFPASFRAFAYQAGVDRIAEAFRASVATLERHRDEARKACYDYLESGEDDDEYDEEGALIRSTSHQLDYLAIEAILSVSIVREAFVTSAFHYWEHSARSYTKLTESRVDFTKICKKLAQQVPISDRLPAINILNNLLKHNRGGLALDLIEEWPDLFSRYPYCAVETKQLVWSITLTNDHVETVFEIIRDSGPRLHSHDPA